MAFAHSGYYGLVSMLDQGRVPTRMRVKLQGATIGAAGTALADFVAKLGAVTDAWIESYTLEDIWKTDVLFTANEPHGRASMKALITVALTTPGKNAAVEIPAPSSGDGSNASIFVAASGQGYDLVDPSLTPVSDFLNVFAAGGDAYISDGENTITGPFVKGIRTTRKSNTV
jgi:hypothetical protein